MLSFIPCSRTSEGLRIWIGDWVIECVLVAGLEKIIPIDLAEQPPLFETGTMEKRIVSGRGHPCSHRMCSNSN